MNYYNPYSMIAPMTSAAKPGIFAAIKGAAGGSGLTLSTIINGTQRTLGIVNQAIPLIKQVTPVVKNAKTMFKVMNEFKKDDTPSSKTTTNNQANAAATGVNENVSTTESENISGSGPTFFI